MVTVIKSSIGRLWRKTQYYSLPTQKRDVTVIRVPWNYDFNTIEYDGLFISNGPGDPDMCDVTVEHIRKAMNGTKPIFGICMGNQLLSKAGGARTYKLKYGHRSHNQPVRQVGDEQVFYHLSESWFCSR